MRTKPEYYWPIWKKLLHSIFWIGVGLFTMGVILFIKFVSTFKKSLDGAETPWIFIGLKNVCFKWEAMWKENPSRY